MTEEEVETKHGMFEIGLKKNYEPSFRENNKKNRRKLYLRS